MVAITVLCSLNACRSKTPWNPYLSAKEKPSDKQRKVENKQIVSGTKAYKELMKKNKKEIKEFKIHFGSSVGRWLFISTPTNFIISSN